ncbi:extracellular solute-binding protein [Paenarthrobacter sp. NPDC092416]|uniref:extracellular solute-binding protein n=1 Tax=Paenarthrobacter sp. NPDC092416 TaxID=3364386 RepID=UPI0037F2DD92
MKNHEKRTQPIPAVDRRSVLKAAAALGAFAAFTPMIGACSSGGSPTAAGTVSRGPGPGGYKIDLGGYQGPELRTEAITIRVMRQSYTDPVNKLVTGMYDRFSAAYPNIKIQEELVPYGDLQQKMQVYVSSGKAPDLMMGRSDFAPAYKAASSTLPMREYFTDSYWQDIAPTLLDSVTFDGQTYAMPWEHLAMNMIINKDLFKLAGVALPPETSDPQKGWTVQEWLKAFKDLRAGFDAQGRRDLWPLAASVFGNGGPGSNYGQLESLWIRMMGDPQADKSTSAYKTFAGISDDGLTSTGYVDTPEAIEGMRNYQRLFQERLTPIGSVPDQMVSSTAAVSFAGPNQAGIWLSGAKPSFDWGVSPLPRGATILTCNASDSMVVWAGSPNPSETAALLGYLNNDANRIEFHKAWGSLPVRNSVIEQIPELRDSTALALAVNMGKISAAAPKTPGWFEYFNTMNPIVKDIALGADPDSALKDAARKVDGQLKKYA